MDMTIPAFSQRGNGKDSGRISIMTMFHKWKVVKDLNKHWASRDVDCKGVDIAYYFYQQWYRQKDRLNDPRMVVMMSLGMVVDGAWLTLHRDRQDEDKWVQHVALFQEWKVGKDLNKHWGPMGVDCQGVDIASYLLLLTNKCTR